MGGKLIIHAPNVHQGGGRTLLLALLGGVGDGVEVCAQLDARLVKADSVPANIEVIRVEPNVAARLRAEACLTKLAGSRDTLLCLGNLPPLFRSHARVFVFVQNYYLVASVSLSHFPTLQRLRLMVERLWLRSRANSSYSFIVQSRTMRETLLHRLGVEPLVLPFFVVSLAGCRRATPAAGGTEKVFDFVYVASADPHKNHAGLLDAWVQLAEEGIFPTLCLTIDKEKFTVVYARMEELKARHGLQIENVFCRSHHEVLALYTRARTLIYPSFFESMGLPLIEARQAGLSVVAGELDFVRDIVDPEESFDPHSPVSIARAVKRFLAIPEREQPLLDAKTFLGRILKAP